MTPLVVTKVARRAPILSILFLGLVPLVSAPGQAAALGRHVVDARFAISFRLPVNWRSATVSRPKSGLTKLKVFEARVAGTEALVQVEVVSGRHLDPAKVAADLGTSSGVTVVGSRIVTFAIGRVEQLRFTAQGSGALVHGTIESFYRAGRTYYVAFDSSSQRVVASALATVMGTWGT